MSLRREATAWTISSSSLSPWTGRGDGLTVAGLWLGVRDPPLVDVESNEVRSEAGKYFEEWCAAEASCGSSTPSVPSPSNKVEEGKEAPALWLLFSSISMRESRLSDSSRRPLGEALTGDSGNSVMHGWYAGGEIVPSSLSETPLVLRRRAGELYLRLKVVTTTSRAREGKKLKEGSVGSPPEGGEFSEHKAGCRSPPAPGVWLKSGSRGCGRKCLKM